MRLVSDIFKLLITKDFYPRKTFMCHAVEEARAEGVISVEEATACVKSIQRVMQEIHDQQQNPYYPTVGTVMYNQISSHPARNPLFAYESGYSVNLPPRQHSAQRVTLAMYKDWDNWEVYYQTFVKDMVAYTEQALEILGPSYADYMRRIVDDGYWLPGQDMLAVLKHCQQVGVINQELGDYAIDREMRLRAYFTEQLPTGAPEPAIILAMRGIDVPNHLANVLTQMYRTHHFAHVIARIAH